MITKTGRHESREYCFQFLYHFQLQGFEEQRKRLLKSNELENEAKVFDETVEYKLDPGSLQFSLNLIQGVLKYYDELEEVISKFSKNWQIHRISKVDHTILLQAIYELGYIKETPMKVVINESLELAKKYGSLDSKNFINGILDSYAKSIHHE